MKHSGDDIVDPHDRRRSEKGALDGISHISGDGSICMPLIVLPFAILDQ